MITSVHFLKQHAARIVVGVLLAFFSLSVILALEESNTYDERAHIPAAYTALDAQDMRLNPEHPPLLKDLAGLPLLLLNIRFPYETDTWQTNVNDQWTAGDLFVNCTNPALVCNDADTITFLARLPLILVAVALGFGLFFFTRELGGPLAGLAAVVLYAADPNIIAHSHYVTTDIGIAAFLFFACIFFIRFLKRPSWKSALVSGLFLGLAQLAKFSAVLLYPLFGIFVILYALARTITTRHEECRSFFPCLMQRLVHYGSRFSGALLVSFALIWLVYAFNTAHMPGTAIAALATFPQENAFGRLANEVVIGLSQHPLTKPWSEYLLGVFMVIGRVSGGNTYYFLGTVSNVATPWYFPLVFLMKETLPFLFLLLLTSTYTLLRLGRMLRGETMRALPLFFARGLENKTTQIIALTFIALYSYLSITGNLNIGIRHLFPLYPFLFLLVAKTLSDIYRRHGESFGFLLRPAGGILFLVILAIPIIAYPSYLSYYNPAAGGSTAGFWYATDSNYDWGQDLKRLQRFVEDYNSCASLPARALRCRHFIKTYATNQAEFFPTSTPIETIRVDYFGGANPAYYLGDRFQAWHSTSTPESGWYAISINFLIENITREHPVHEQTYTWTKNLQPVARAGDSIFIYYLP